MEKVILVTGGSGFIGSHLCDRLIKQDNVVICLDNLITGSLKNIVHLMSKPNFHFFRHDVVKPFRSRKFDKIDQIYHLASPADPNAKSRFSYMAHPFETMQTNTVGTWNMCELALKNGAKLSFASTSEIYGDPLVSVQDESYRGNVSTTGPRSVYDESKRFGETIVAAYVREKGLDGQITRIFNTYGPRMNLEEGRSIVSFIRQSIRSLPITVYGDGKQTRSFCYIDDQVDGQIKVMEKGEKGSIFNIGSDDELTILELAQLIKELTGTKSKIIFKQLPEDDPKQRKPNIERAKKILSWQPKVALSNGLLRTIEYCREADS